MRSLKKDLEIEVVLNRDQVKAYSKPTMVIAALLNLIVVSRSGNYSFTVKWLEPDGAKHAEGIYLAENKFLSTHLMEVFSNL
jgi:hypothetical protein